MGEDGRGWLFQLFRCPGRGQKGATAGPGNLGQRPSAVGLDILNKKKLSSLKVSPIANPAAPMLVPNILGMIPGSTWAATFVMKRMMSAQRIIFQMAEVAVPREVFAEMLKRIDRLRCAYS